MTERVCPYLRTFDDANRYVSRADEANGCYSSPDRPGFIPLDFQDGTCLGSEFARCSRYKSAGRQPVGRRERQLLIISAGLGGLLLLATCVFLGIMALTLGSVEGGGLLSRVTQTPTATLTPLPTDVLTPTLTATLTPTLTLTPTPSQTPSPTPSPTWTSGTIFNSPVATPTPSYTATPRPTTPWQPPASSTPWPTNTPSRTPTAGTPTATLTRTSTPLPTANCRTDDVMTITPATPAIGALFTIEVKSLAAYTDVSLVASSGTPRFNGVKKCAGYYCWKWEDSQDAGGTYTYSFKIRGGAATCVSKSITITAPTDTPTITPTPTPSPTPTPFFDFGVYTIGPVSQSVFPGESVIPFELSLRHLGNRDDSYSIWLEETTPASWSVQFCIGDTGTCFAPSDRQTITLHPNDPDLKLYIKVTVGGDALGGDKEDILIKVQSLTSLTVKDKTVTVNVK